MKPDSLSFLTLATKLRVIRRSAFTVLQFITADCSITNENDNTCLTLVRGSLSQVVLTSYNQGSFSRQERKPLGTRETRYTYKPVSNFDVAINLRYAKALLPSRCKETT